VKIFEILIYCRLNQHLLINNVVVPEQFGFRKGLSINNATYKPLETLYQARNKECHIVRIFCDLTKAFDCVSHELLLRKLQYYGDRGVWFELIKSYLSDRKQRVDLKFISPCNQLSRWKSIKCGVQQGSVLGPFSLIFT
jgi:hypothetical protein